MRFGHWESIKELGAGGQGKVYLAHDIAKFNRSEINASIADLVRKLSAVAIQPKQKDEYSKQLSEALLKLNGVSNIDNLGALKKLHDSNEARDYSLAIPRMKREIKALQSIEHKNITKILDANIDEHWFVTEYYPKGNLKQNKHRFIGKPLKTLSAFRHLVEGVANLHANGLVHRDIKPENIFLLDSTALVLGDFGLVYFPDEQHTRISETFENVGSRDWMPPWAMGIKQEEVKSSFDVFGLGKILWYMLAQGEILQLWYFKDEKFNLEKLYPNNQAIKLINAILGQCLVEKERDCLLSATELLKLIDEVLMKIESNADLLTKEDLQRPCRICGVGIYKLVANENITTIRNFGLEPHGSSSFKIFTCDNCGHVQLFHIPANNYKPPLWQ